VLGLLQIIAVAGLVMLSVATPKEKGRQNVAAWVSNISYSKAASLMPPLGSLRRECRNMVNEWLTAIFVKPLEGRRVTFVKGLEGAERGRHGNAVRSALSPSKAGETE